MSSYTVEERDGVTLVTGSLPIDAFSYFSNSLGEQAIMDFHLASLAKVNYAFGLPAACKAMSEALTAQKMSSRTTTIGMWDTIGEKGMSSEWLYSCLNQLQRLSKTDPNATLTPDARRTYYPHDPADLRRCRLMLEMEPQLQPFLQQAKGLSPVWDALLVNWDSLCSTMDTESPTWRDGSFSCKKTYAAMCKIINEAEGRKK